MPSEISALDLIVDVFGVWKICKCRRFQDQLSKLLNTQVAGYIEPGYGLEGKQRTLIDDDDLDEMSECTNMS